MTFALLLVVFGLAFHLLYTLIRLREEKQDNVGLRKAWLEALAQRDAAEAELVRIDSSKLQIYKTRYEEHGRTAGRLLEVEA